MSLPFDILGGEDLFDSESESEQSIASQFLLPPSSPAARSSSVAPSSPVTASSPAPTSSIRDTPQHRIRTPLGKKLYWFDRQIQAVIVNTTSFAVRAGVPQYDAITLSDSDDIFKAGDPPSISKVFGIPLAMCPLRPEDRPELNPFLQEAQVPNLLIRSLYRNCDVTAFDPTAKPYDWDHQFGEPTLPSIEGPVILARVDKKPLHPLHVQMILEYLDEHVDALFDGYRVERKRWRKRMDVGEYRDKINEMRGEVEGEVKAGKMRVRWGPFMERVRVGDETWEWLQSPWEI